MGEGAHERAVALLPEQAQTHIRLDCACLAIPDTHCLARKSRDARGMHPESQTQRASLDNQHIGAVTRGAWDATTKHSYDDVTRPL